MPTRRLFKIGSSGNKIPKDVACNIMVLGAPNVGKTAFTVRYLTKKYLPEYAHGESITYERAVAMEGKFIHLRIIDTPGKFCENLLKNSWTPFNQDVFIVMYSVAELESFALVEDMLKLLASRSPVDRQQPQQQQQQQQDGSSQSEQGSLSSSSSSSTQQQDCFHNIGPAPLVYLVGNKSDLSHFRCISYAEGQRLCLSHPETTFFECSTAAGPDEVGLIFADLLQKVLRRYSLLPRASLSGSLTVLSSWSSQQTPRRNTFSASTSGSGWWRRHRNSNDQSRTDRTFTM